MFPDQPASLVSAMNTCTWVTVAATGLGSVCERQRQERKCQREIYNITEFLETIYV